MNKLTQNQGKAILPKIRKVLMKYNFAMLMAFQLMFFSCTKDKVVADLSSPKVQNMDALKDSNVSDEDVFRGVIFLRGPVSSMFEEYREMSIEKILTDQDQLTEAKQFQEDMMSEIDARYPGFYSDFRANVTSGDYGTVEGALRDAAEKIQEVSIDLTGKSNSEMNSIAQAFIADHNLSDQSTQDEALQAIRDDGGTQNLIAILLVAVLAVVWLWAWVYDAASSVTLGSYARAELTADITVRMENYN